MISDAEMPKNRGRGTSVRQPGFLPFWHSVQSVLNNFLRKLAVVGNVIHKSFVNDEHKVEYSSGHDSDRCGALEKQHARANRRGFSDHQLVQSASQFLVGVAFEGYGDTIFSSTMRLIKDQLMPSVGEMPYRDLLTSHSTSIMGRWGGNSLKSS